MNLTQRAATKPKLVLSKERKTGHCSDPIHIKLKLGSKII